MKRWTPEDDAALTQMCAEMKSVAEMAQALGRTEGATFTRKSYLGLRTKDAKTLALFEDQTALARIQKGLREGRLHLDLAKELGVSVNAVVTAAKRHGWRRACTSSPYRKGAVNRRYSEELVSSVRQLYEVEQLPVTTVCRALGIRPSQLHYICGQYRIANAKATRRWSEGDIETLLRLLSSQTPIDEVCRQLNRSDVAVVSRCEILKVQRRYPEVMKRKNELKAQRCTFEKVLRSKLTFARNRAKAGMPFDLTLEGLLALLSDQKGRCHYTGLELSPFPSDPNTVSIDRVDSARGYTLDNVVLCLWDVNRMKQDMPIDRLLELCRLLVA